MSEKVFKEYCEDCGCPLDICCKPQQPVVSLQAIKKWIKKNKFGYKPLRVNAEELTKWAETQSGQKQKKEKRGRKNDGTYQW